MATYRLVFCALACLAGLSIAPEVNLQELAAKNYYELIGVSKDVSARDLTRALRKAAAQFHPDTVRDEGEKKKKEKVFLRIQKAQEVFDDPMMRRQYDKMVEHGIVDYDFEKLSEIIGPYQPGSYDQGEHVQDSISDEEAGPMLTWGLGGLVVSCLLPVLYVQWTNNRRPSAGKLLKKQGVNATLSGTDREQIENEIKARKEAQERQAAENRRMEEEKAARLRLKQEEQQSELRRRREREEEGKKKQVSKKEKATSPTNAENARKWDASDDAALESAAASIATSVPNRLALIVDSMKASLPAGSKPYTVNDIQRRIQAVDAARASAVEASREQEELKAPAAAPSAAAGKKGKKGKSEHDPEEADWEKGERPKKKADEPKAASGEASKKKSPSAALSPHSPPFEPAKAKDATPTAAAAVTWSAEEQKALDAALAAHPKSEAKRWESIAAEIPGKTPQQCMDRAREQAERLRALYDV